MYKSTNCRQGFLWTTASGYSCYWKLGYHVKQLDYLVIVVHKKSNDNKSNRLYCWANWLISTEIWCFILTKKCRSSINGGLYFFLFSLNFRFFIVWPGGKSLKAFVCTIDKPLFKPDKLSNGSYLHNRNLQQLGCFFLLVSILC